MKKNQGYTLIEMLIVIAIMAILSGVAVVTLNVIKEAKCNAAMNTFENQISATWIKTKALSQGKIQANPTSTDEKATYPLSLLVKKNTDNDDVRDGSYEMILGYDNGLGFVEKERLAVLTDIISIKYISGASQRHRTLTSAAEGDSTDSILIQFNKSDGSVKYGAGTYEIIYNDRVFGTIILDEVTGNHYIK